MKSPKAFIPLLMFVLLGICKANDTGRVRDIVVIPKHLRIIVNPLPEEYDPVILPNYGDQNIVSDQEEKITYIQGIAITLDQQDPAACAKHQIPHTLTYYLTNFGADFFELHKFNDGSPLFIIRIHLPYVYPNIRDYKIYTNSEKSKIKRIEFVDYKIVSESEEQTITRVFSQRYCRE